MTPRVLITALMLAGLVSAGPQGNGRGRGRGHGHGGDAGEGIPATEALAFAPNDVTVIHQYYGAHPGNLPPGLQKKVARGKPLPPGWQKKLQPFPPAVSGILPPPCSYCVRGVVDGYGVIYDKRTSVILDIIQLAVDLRR